MVAGDGTDAVEERLGLTPGERTVRAHADEPVQAVRRIGVVQVDPRVAFEVRMHRDAEQSALRVADHRKRDERPIDEPAVGRDDPHVAGLLLREQQRPVGQERHVRREREVVEEPPRREVGGGGRCGEGGDDHEGRDRESGRAHPSTVSRDGTMAGSATMEVRECIRSITWCSP